MKPWLRRHLAKKKAQSCSWRECTQLKRITITMVHRDGGPAQNFHLCNNHAHVLMASSSKKEGPEAAKVVSVIQRALEQTEQRP